MFLGSGGFRLQVCVTRKDGKVEEEEKVYESLAVHLDRLPAGFPRTSTGVEMRILRRLFSPEEAALAQLLGLKPETPGEIAVRKEMNEAELAESLEKMALKGLIFRIRRGGAVRYMAAQFVIGVWEYHVNDLDPDLIKDFNEYLPHFFEKGRRLKTPQLRTIPIEKSLSADQRVMPYEEARKIVLDQERIVAAPCICRKEHRISGGGCEKPLETCLVFGIGAEYYEENGLGRAIDPQEALDILANAEKAGLVLQPSNAQNVVNICACCGCCCQILKNLKKLPNPGQFTASNYFATLDEGLCTGCGACTTRCQMDALRIDGETAVVTRDRCIGCGLCVSACPEEALSLEARPEEERKTPPAHLRDTYRQIAKERIARLRNR